MSTLKTIGLFNKDTRIYYVATGITILKDPEGVIKIFYEEGMEDRVDRAIKMSEMEPFGEVVTEEEGHFSQVLKEV